MTIFSVLFLAFTSVSTKDNPDLSYQIYLDDQVIGMIKYKDKEKLEEYFVKEGKKVQGILSVYEKEILRQEDVDLIIDLCSSNKTTEEIIEYIKEEHPNIDNDVLNIVKTTDIKDLKSKLNQISLTKEEVESRKEYIEKHNIYKYSDDFLLPNGVEIRKIYTYNNNYSTVKEVYDRIQKIKTTSIMAYRIAIKGEDKIEYLYAINKQVFEEAINLTISTFVGTDNFRLYVNDDQIKIETTGEYIDSIFIEENITLKEMKSSVSEKIYTTAEELSQYLLFGNKENSSIYTVKLGDSIESVALKNKVNVEEIFMSNPEFTSVNNVLSVGRKIIINELNPKIKVAVVKTVVEDQEHSYDTVKTVDENLIVGYQKVTQKGVKGLDRITFKTYAINGQEVKAEIINKQVIKEPIDEKITVGGRYIPSVGSTDIWKWPTESGWHISTYWGWRNHPIYGYREFHKAVDVYGPAYGSRIFAANNGTVQTASYSWSYGNYVLINHNNGFYTLYAHMSRLAVSTGQVVGKGDVIGYLGSSGTATGPHLHYEVWHGAYWSGTTVNPLSLRYQ